MWQFCVLNFVAVFELKTLFEASLEDTNLFAGLTQRKLSEALGRAGAVDVVPEVKEHACCCHHDSLDLPFWL
jgi:hypothetical protein